MYETVKNYTVNYDKTWIFDKVQLLLSLSVKLDSLQIVVPHAGRVLQDAPSRTFTILYSNDQNLERIEKLPVLI